MVAFSRNLFPDRRDVMGGSLGVLAFLAARLRETVEASGALNPDIVIPLHCSGEPFIEIMKAEVLAKLLRGHTGAEFIFNA